MPPPGWAWSKCFFLAVGRDGWSCGIDKAAPYTKHSTNSAAGCTEVQSTRRGNTIISPVPVVPVCAEHFAEAFPSFQLPALSPVHRPRKCGVPSQALSNVNAVAARHGQQPLRPFLADVHDFQRPNRTAQWRVVVGAQFTKHVLCA